MLAGVTHTIGVGQNRDNYLTVNILPLNFVLDNYTELENEQRVTEGVQLATQSKRAYQVYVRVSSTESTSGMPLPVSMFALQLNRKVASSQCVAPFNKFILSSVNQLLLHDYNKTTKDEDNFYYNFLFGPVGYDYPPGNYTVTLLFTMTQP